MAASGQEQYLLELTNEARLDPLADAARYIASYDPLIAKQADIQSAVDYFGVSGPDLLAAYTALTPVQPLAWNDSLADASRQHDRAMIAADEQSHQLPGEAVFTSRDAAAGYAFTDRGAENVYAYADNGLYTQAGFVIDWGNSEPGHRDNIMDPALREVGIGILPNTNTDPQFGPQVVTEDFGSHGTSGTFLLGVAYTDSDHDNFYSVGEGVAGLTVSVAGASATSSDAGGYTLDTTATGYQTVTLTGGNLTGAVSVGLDLEAGRNIKLDVVGGHTLLTSASVNVDGPVSTIQGLGLTGLTITAGAGSYSIVGTPGGDTLTGGSGGDLIAGRQGNDVIAGRQGNDTLGGGQGEDVIGGGQGDDQLRGGAGDDILHGGQGNDVLFGGLGNDVLFGGQGDDSLAGGMGDDTLTGGAGNNRFVFGFASGHDLITDFSGGDKLDLQGQTYSIGMASDGSALLGLSGGGSIDLAGVTVNQVNRAIFV